MSIKKKFIGLMSGTSADSIDAVLIALGYNKFEILLTHSVKISADSTGVSVGGSPTGMEDNSFSPDLDKAINDFERFINKERLQINLKPFL